MACRPCEEKARRMQQEMMVRTYGESAKTPADITTENAVREEKNDNFKVTEVNSQYELFKKRLYNTQAIY